MVKSLSLSLGTILCLIAGHAQAGDVTIVGAQLQKSGAGTFTLSATLEHADTGWDHYADAFEARLDDGTVLGTRILLHPHVNEQPFTRSLTSVAIPDGTQEILIFARDTEHGWSETSLTIPVPAD